MTKRMLVLGGILSLVFTGLTSAWAQEGKLVKAVVDKGGEGLAKTETAIVRQAQALAAASGGVAAELSVFSQEKGLESLPFHEQFQFYYPEGDAPRLLTLEEIQAVASGEISFTRLNTLEKEDFLLHAPQEVFAQRLALGEEPRQILAEYYRSQIGNKELGEKIRAVLNLSVLGTPQDARAIYRVATESEPLYDALFIRSLNALESTDYIQQLLKYRLEEGKPLSDAWAQFKLYSEQKGFALEVPSQNAISNQTRIALNHVDLKTLSFQPYNIIFLLGQDGELAEHLAHIRAASFDLKATAVQHKTTQAVKNRLEGTSSSALENLSLLSTTASAQASAVTSTVGQDAAQLAATSQELVAMPVNNPTDKFAKYKAWVKENGYLPSKTAPKGSEEWELASWSAYAVHKFNSEEAEQLSEFRKTYPKKQRYLADERQKREGKLEQYQAWVEEHGYLPSKAVPKESEEWVLANWSANALQTRDTPATLQLKELRAKYPTKREYQDNERQKKTSKFSEYQEWTKQHGYLPSQKAPKGSKEWELARWSTGMLDRFYREETQQLKEFRKTYPTKRRYMVDERQRRTGRLDEYQAWVEEHGYLPSSSAPKESQEWTLANWCINVLQRQDTQAAIKLQELHAQYPTKRKYEYNERQKRTGKLEEYQAWTEENGYLPSSSAPEGSKERELADWGYRMLDRFDSEVAEQLKEFRAKYPNKRTYKANLKYLKNRQAMFARYKAWVEKHGYLPSRVAPKKSEEQKISNWGNNVILIGTDKEIIRQLQEFRAKYPTKKSYEAIQSLKQEVLAFYEEHGRLPKQQQHDDKENALAMILSKHLRTYGEDMLGPQIKGYLMEQKVARQCAYEDRLYELKEWVKDNGFRPSRMSKEASKEEKSLAVWASYVLSGKAAIGEDIRQAVEQLYKEYLLTRHSKEIARRFNRPAATSAEQASGGKADAKQEPTSPVANAQETVTFELSRLDNAQYEEYHRGFAKWLQTHEEFLINNGATNKAFELLKIAVAKGEDRALDNVRDIVYWLQRKGEDALFLGQADGTFTQLIYRGPMPEQARELNLHDFHTYSEIAGLPRNLELPSGIKMEYDRQGKAVLKLPASHDRQAAKNAVMELFEKWGVSGGTIRMGTDELGISNKGNILVDTGFGTGRLHVHLEKIGKPKKNMNSHDIGYTVNLRVDVTDKKSLVEIAELYEDLFSDYFGTNTLKQVDAFLKNSAGTTLSDSGPAHQRHQKARKGGKKFDKSAQWINSLINKAKKKQ